MAALFIARPLKCGNTLIILLCSGEKHGQQRDIRKARALARQLEP